MLVKLLLAALVLLPVVVLVVGALRGRARVTSCCSVPAEQDARLAGAYGADRVTAAGPPAP